MAIFKRIDSKLIDSSIYDQPKPASDKHPLKNQSIDIQYDVYSINSAAIAYAVQDISHIASRVCDPVTKMTPSTQ